MKTVNMTNKKRELSNDIKEMNVKLNLGGGGLIKKKIGKYWGYNEVQLAVIWINFKSKEV